MNTFWVGKVFVCLFACEVRVCWETENDSMTQLLVGLTQSLYSQIKCLPREVNTVSVPNESLRKIKNAQSFHKNFY